MPNPLLNNTEPNQDEDIKKLIAEFDMDDYGTVNENGHYLIKRVVQLISDHDAQLYEELMAGEELVIDHGSNFNDMKQLWAVPLDHIKTVMKGDK